MNDKANAVTPAHASPSELESEFRDGIPSTVGSVHMPKEKNYHVYVTINTPKGEFDQGCMAYSLDEVMRDVLVDHPSCTSVVMTIVLGVTTLGQL